MNNKLIERIQRTAKKKQKRKLTAAIKKVKKAKKKEVQTANFPALNLIHDPQSTAEVANERAYPFTHTLSLSLSCMRNKNMVAYYSMPL